MFYIAERQFKEYAREMQGTLTEDGAAASTNNAWEVAEGLNDVATPIAMDAADVWMARKLRSVHNDLEDNLVIAAAERANADYIVTSDAKLLQNPHVRALTAADMLTHLQVFNLHSSLVQRREGDAILFTAPSGTGKSTQAGLWEQFAGADTLNGDRSMLRRVDGRWTAFGSPFAGTSGIYRNESAPVRALVVLRQAPENTIRRLPLAEAFRAIYSESVLPRWHTEAHQRVISLVTEIVSELPVYLLACTPDERPVTLLRNTLEGEPT